MSAAVLRKRHDEGVLSGFARRRSGRTMANWSRGLIATQQAVGAAEGDVGAVMNAVAEGALKVLPQAGGAIVAMRRADGAMICEAASGTTAGLVGFLAEGPRGFGGRAMRAGRPLLCVDAEEDPRVDRAGCRAAGIRSVIAVPLPRHGKIVGVLKVHAPAPNAFGAEDILLVQLLAGPIVVGLGSLAEAEAERARHDAVRRFEATFEKAAIGIAHVGLDGHFLLVNRRFAEITGHRREALMAEGFQKITHPDDLAEDLVKVSRLLNGEADDYVMEKRYLRPDGESVWVKLSVTLVRTDAGAPDFFVSIIEDLTDQRRAEAEAVRDPLTQLLNRRGLIERLRRLLSRSAQSAEPVGLVYLDLDGFKPVNDRYGHYEGDRCLQAVSSALVEAVRPGDALARVGGDEFVAVMPGLGEADLLTAAERMRLAVGEAGARWRLAASVGAISVAAGGAGELEALIASADRAMYAAKQAGGNRTVIGAA